MNRERKFSGLPMFDRMLSLGFETAMLAVESQQVIALRLLHLAAGGPDALHEANRMVVEKAAAVVESGARLAAGQGPEPILRSYRHKVQANRRRLAVALPTG